MARWGDKLRKLVPGKKKELPEGLWMNCPHCGAMIYRKEVQERHRICPDCAYHFPLTADERIALLTDPGSFEEFWAELGPTDPLDFKALSTYRDKITEAQRETGRRDAIVTGRGRIRGLSSMIGVIDSRFIMGSMGSVMGEKIARSFERADAERLPVVIVSGSGGGARMYEGALSLMQMAKTSAAIARFHEGGGLFVSVLTNPTMAGVMASFASLGDVILAEPKALIGFTGPRVILQTIRQALPTGFQTSEFMLEKGFIDRIVHRKDLADEIARFIRHLAPETKSLVSSP